MNCWKCHKQLSDIPVKIAFRATCPHCDIDLHTCVNCRYYAPGKPNDCAVPGTDYIRDREAANFCEEYKIKTEALSSEQEQAKKRFNSLFKEEN
jgi:hypothetical protein